MIIQCPACNTSFSVSTEKFGTKNRKVKCSKCYFIWTANSQGKAIEVPPLYESINSQGGVIKENKNETLDPNIKPDHPLPVPVREKDNKKGDFLSVILILVLFLSLGVVWYNRIFLLENFPILRPVLEFVDPSINIRGIDIYNLESRATIINNKESLIVSGSLINQSNYMRIVPNIIVKIVGPDEKVIMQEIIVLNDEYFEMNEQKSFSTNFINYPKNANKVLIEIIP